MAAGACIAPNSNHHTVRRSEATRGPGAIAGLESWRFAGKSVRGMIRPATWTHPTQPIRKGGY